MASAPQERRPTLLDWKAIKMGRCHYKASPQKHKGETYNGKEKDCRH